MTQEDRKEKERSPNATMNALLRRSDPDDTTEEPDARQDSPKPNHDMNATIRRLAGRQ